jgi:hypothetical protein
MLRGLDSSLGQELPQSCVFNIEPKLFFTGQYANPCAFRAIQAERSPGVKKRAAEAGQRAACRKRKAPPNLRGPGRG